MRDPERARTFDASAGAAAGEGGIDGVPGSSAAVAMDQARCPLAPVAGLETLEVTDRQPEGERPLDRRQAACQQLGPHVEPALLTRAQGDGRGIHSDRVGARG